MPLTILAEYGNSLKGSGLLAAQPWAGLSRRLAGRDPPVAYSSPAWAAAVAATAAAAGLLHATGRFLPARFYRVRHGKLGFLN